MDSFLGTLVFLLPGLMLYFWLQSFGINPVVRHSTAEFTAIAVLLWLPISLISLLVINLLLEVSEFLNTLNPIWTTDELKNASSSFKFLIIFLGTSLFISFLFGVIWAKWIHEQIFLKVINKVRTSRGVAAFSKSASVWDEVFLNNDSQVVEIGKVDNNEERFIGEIKKVSRTFEPERLVLNDIDFFTELVNNHSIPIVNVYVDTKTGMYIKIFDPVKIKEAQLDGEETISS
jgi:hypothetical protein